MTKYLRPDVLRANSALVPVENFIVRPADFRVIDGDTISVLSNELNDRGLRVPSFSIRLRSVMAPERMKKKMTATDVLLSAMGRQIRQYDPGAMSHEISALLTRARCLFVIPNRERLKDKYGRLIADVYVSGLAGKSFSSKKSFSLERVLHEDGLVSPAPGEDLPHFDFPVERYLRHEAPQNQSALSL